jgi:hypothetical protein
MTPIRIHISKKELIWEAYNIFPQEIVNVSKKWTKKTSSIRTTKSIQTKYHQPHHFDIILTLIHDKKNA